MSQVSLSKSQHPQDLLQRDFGFTHRMTMMDCAKSAWRHFEGHSTHSLARLPSQLPSPLPPCTHTVHG